MPGHGDAVLICDGRAPDAPIPDRPSQIATDRVKLSQVEPPHAISFEFVNTAQNVRTQRFSACQKDKRGQPHMTVERKHKENNIQGIRDESIARNVRSFGTRLPIGRRYPQAARAVFLWTTRCNPRGKDSDSPHQNQGRQSVAHARTAATGCHADG